MVKRKRGESPSNFYISKLQNLSIVSPRNKRFERECAPTPSPKRVMLKGNRKESKVKEQYSPQRKKLKSLSPLSRLRSSSSFKDRQSVSTRKLPGVQSPRVHPRLRGCSPISEGSSSESPVRRRDWRVDVSPLSMESGRSRRRVKLPLVEERSSSWSPFTQKSPKSGRRARSAEKANDYYYYYYYYA